VRRAVDHFQAVNPYATFVVACGRYDFHFSLAFPAMRDC